jgi:hypothetical protein
LSAQEDRAAVCTHAVDPVEVGNVGQHETFVGTTTGVYTFDGSPTAREDLAPGLAVGGGVGGSGGPAAGPRRRGVGHGLPVDFWAVISAPPTDPGGAR